jgi:hypothetical protein
VHEAEILIARNDRTAKRGWPRLDYGSYEQLPVPDPPPPQPEVVLHSLEQALLQSWGHPVPVQVEVMLKEHM